MQNSSLNNSIDDIKKWQDALHKQAEESEDVKNKKCTIEDEKREPAFMLYNQIAETSVKLLQLPEIVAAFAMLSKSIGEDEAKTLVEVLALTMTQSAYQAICFYDELLKAELTKQFDNVGEHLNTTRADVEAHSGVLAVFRKQLSEIQNKMKIETFTKENDIEN